LLDLHVVEEEGRSHETIMRRPDLEELTSLRVVGTDSVLVVDVKSRLVVDHAERVVHLTVLEMLNVGALGLVEFDDDLTGVWPGDIEMLTVGVSAEGKTVGVVHLKRGKESGNNGQRK